MTGVPRGVQFGLVAAVLIFGAAWGITTLRPDADVARAVWSSAFIAFGVQLVTYLVAKPFLAKNPIAGWGLGSLIRMSVLVLHAFVGVKALELSSTPALLSLAGFLFVTMLVEPLFLKP